MSGIKQSVSQYGHDEIPERVIVQWEDEKHREQQIIVERSAMTAEQLELFDAYKKMVESFIPQK